MSEAEKVFLGVSTFRLGTDKEAALKPLEEAAEVFGAWQTYGFFWGQGCKELDNWFRAELADEIADCVTACVNLAVRYGIDLQEAIDRVEQSNRVRGRYK